MKGEYGFLNVQIINVIYLAEINYYYMDYVFLFGKNSVKRGGAFQVIFLVVAHRYKQE